MKIPKRRLAAIMFTDIVGYSAMMQQDELIANRIRTRHKEVFNRLNKQFNGKILQYFGDGTLSIFPSAAAAVECGVALQLELKKAPPVPIRIGIHTGDITYSDEEAYGDGVNVAARIETLCIPGGVFISEKVYDDIKNHPQLTAMALGAFDLKNIKDDIRVYAVNNRGITVPEETPKQASQQKPAQPKVVGKRKRKFAAGFLALFFGLFGMHRFYLGQRNLGVLYLAITLTAMFILPSLGNLVGMMAIISFVDAILIWTSSRASFDEKYNAHLVSTQTKEQTEKTAQQSFLKDQFAIHFQRGTQFYQDYHFQEAIDQLSQAVAIKYDEPEAHFLLARCYSMLENGKKAFAHLDAAVAFGFKSIPLIHELDELAYLRTQAEFDDFVDNGYRILEPLPPISEEESRPAASAPPDVLEQLNRLQQLYQDGILTEQEYLEQEMRLRENRQ